MSRPQYLGLLELWQEHSNALMYLMAGVAIPLLAVLVHCVPDDEPAAQAAKAEGAAAKEAAAKEPKPRNYGWWLSIIAVVAASTACFWAAATMEPAEAKCDGPPSFPAPRTPAGGSTPPQSEFHAWLQVKMTTIVDDGVDRLAAAAAEARLLTAPVAAVVSAWLRGEISLGTGGQCVVGLATMTLVGVLFNRLPD